MQTYFVLLPALLYGVCAALPAGRRRAIAVGIAVAWLAHGFVLAQEVLLPASLRLGFAVMLSATLWISVATYWLENRISALEGLRVLVLPCAAVAVLLPLAFPGSVVPLAGRPAVFAWHIAVSLLAYSALTIAAFHAVLMALQESSLHAHAPLKTGRWMTAALERLPALLTMEKLLFRMIGLGFVLLTLTVLSGVVFSEQLFGQPVQWNHKTIFTLLSWGMFGALLVGRRWRGWRGKTALGFTLGGFATLLLAYVGSRFVLEVILHRVAA